jgi:hypothetical protein
VAAFTASLIFIFQSNSPSFADQTSI